MKSILKALSSTLIIQYYLNKDKQMAKLQLKLKQAETQRSH